MWYFNSGEPNVIRKAGNIFIDFFRKLYIVYIDSPMAVDATNIFNRNEMTCFREEARGEIENGENPIQFADQINALCDKWEK